MSYSIDRSRPVALQQSDGVWSLEVEELIRVTRNTFRPKRQKVTGVDAIMQHLQLHQGPLAGATRAVFEQAAGGLEARFELRGGGWVPVPELESLPAQQSQSAVGSASAGMLEGSARQEWDAMQQRIQHLERTVALLSEELANAAMEMPPASADHEAADEMAATGEEPQASSVEPEAEQEPEPDFAALKVPQLDAVMDLVKGLAGDDVSLTPVDATEWDFEERGQGHLAVLKNDSGEVVGALLMDLEATIRLAGGMLMEPAEELDSQVEGQSPSEDILDAAGEVLNTLTSAVNKVSGNPHVRAGGLEVMDFEANPWMKKPRVRSDLKCNIGGTVVILGR
ncbi:MAG: hypothetical protein OXU20_15770 [Myxococcales bacterium]|nr:hypothetical protein [Myxococcales bacterium]